MNGVSNLAQHKNVSNFAGVPSENCLRGRREDFLDRRLNQGRS